MDFDLSKENIQPLRGGRNVSQLEVALQAQSDVDLQQELLQQKGAFEEAIRTYTGDDPLDNWYNYISWVEQSYPKHGHEGNLGPLLEDCLSKFENDERYIHDRRFCKLWIKYIDLQQNPLELFQLLYSKGICKSCADLYRAWAYYHEAASDFKKADIVFQLGLGEMAQPYEELVFAHKNMYEAFGRHSLQGVDERRLIEQRQALTSLKTYKHNHRTIVPSVRVGNQILHSNPGSLQQNLPRQERNSNVPVSLYEDSAAAVAGPSIGGASAVISILDVAKKQEVQKENTLKPGTWKKSIITKKLPHNHVPSFTVHEDEDPQFAGGIRLPPNFTSTNQDDFSTWVTDLYFPEPHDPRHVPMYPKHLVYAEQPNKEYSLEEIRARKWFAKKQQQQQQQVNASVNMQETMMEDANIIIQRTDEVQQAVNSILHTDRSNVVREQLERQSPVIVQNFSQNLAPNDSHFMPPNTPHFGLPKNPEQRQSILPVYNHQDHFNPDIQNSMYVQSYMPTNISGFHLANSTKNPDPIYQPSDTTINNCAEQFHQAVSGPSVSFVFHQNFPQEECSMPALPNTSERFMTQNNSAERFMPQNNSAERFMPQNNSVERFMGEQNTHSIDNQSASRQMYHQTSHLDKSGMYQPHNQVSQSVSVYQQNASSSFINSSAKMYQTSEPSVSYHHQNVSNYEPPQHHPMQQRQQQQQWLPNNGAVMQKVHEWPNATTSTSSDDNYTVNMREAIKDINEIWKDNTTHIQPSLELQKPEISKFQIHEDTKLQDLDSKPPSTGVKRSPFAIFSDEDETHTSQNKSDPNKLHFNIYEDDDKQKSPPQKLRSNMRAPFSAQSEAQFPRPIGIPETFNNNKKDDFARPAEVKKLAPFPVFEDENVGATGFSQPSFDDSCTTQTFNINLNQLKASTPFNYKKIAAQQFANNNTAHNTENNTMRQSKKVLFDENQDERKEETREEKLSVIFEKSNESRYSSSSSSSGTTLKTTTFHRESLKVIPEASYSSNEDSMAKANSLQKQLKQQPDCFTLEEKQETVITSSATTYDVLKMFLMKDDNSETSPMKDKIIDLTHDDSGDLQPFKFKERGAGDAPHLRPSAVTNYVSPVKNLFREMSCDSNDSFSSSPTKGSRMEVDINSLINSNSEFQMEQETQDVPIEKPILSKAPSDPFSSKLIATILTKVGFSRPKYAKHYFEMQNLPRLIGKKEVACFNDDKYLVEKVVGKGAFGSVYKAVDLTTNELVALKLQKPANKWEYYITKEVQDRITNPYMKIAFMDVTSCYVSPTASVLVSQFHKIGSLLDITNKVKQMTGKGLKELISIYYASEIITIVNTLHQCKIIHADIKPDNFLVTKMPPEFGYPSLQLIDFGSSIDMSLFPDGTSFKSVVNTENFVCTEMKDGRPWTYQTDIFCVAATIHVLLFDKYMQVQKSGSAWSIAQRIPRYLQTDLWKSFFFEMLNIESCDKLPNLNDFKLRFEEITSKQSEELQMEMKLMANSVLGR